MLGAPFGGCIGSGQPGTESLMVMPILPDHAWPAFPLMDYVPRLLFVAAAMLDPSPLFPQPGGRAPSTHNFACQDKVVNGHAKHGHDTMIERCSLRSP